MTAELFADRDGVIWFDGELVPWREAKVHVLTHTLHYGLGVFEGVRAYKTDKGPVIFRLKDHTERLFRSAHILNLKIPYSRDELNRAQCTVIKENGLEEGYIRPMCFYGSEAMGLRAEGLKTHVIIAAWSWPNYMSPEARFEGIKVLPINTLDGRVIGNGARGPLTEKLQRIYFDQVMGRRNEYPEWSTLVK